MLGEIIKENRKKRGYTQAQFADLLHITKSTVSMYENNQRKPNYEMLESIADVLNIDITVLFYGDNVAGDPMPRMKRVPILGTVACGEPIYAEQNYDGEALCPESMRADFCLRAKGDSMINARINDGDLVYILKAESVPNGTIAAVRIGEEATLKRVYYYPEEHKIVLAAENPRYAPIVINTEAGEDVAVMGRAVGASISLLEA